MSIRDLLADELDRAFNWSYEKQELVEPTDEERRNGWTAETLTDYLASRKAGQSLAVDPTSLHRMLSERPRAQNSRFNPHRWRR